jgi:hypothetical protein
MKFMKKQKAIWIIISFSLVTGGTWNGREMVWL